MLSPVLPAQIDPPKMSVEQLRARIVELDSEIELQKKLLEKLETDKICVLHQLNAALDPVARLPREISSEIFLLSLAPSPTGEQDVPTALLRICNAWSGIALSTPRLWTTVRIHFPCGDHCAEVLLNWFKRARNLPLSISISLVGRSINWNHRVSDVLWRHAGQLEHLEILDDDEFDPDTFAFDLFGDTPPVSLPLLQTLAIRCQRRERLYLAPQTFQLLRGASNIVEFISDKAQIYRNIPDLEGLPLVVPTLRRVIFGETLSGDEQILLYLALPALETLSLPMWEISSDDLVAFVERSAAPLCDLTLGSHFRPTRSFHLHKYLHLIPTLTRFTIWLPHLDVAMELFADLAGSPSLLPNLHDLTIHILDVTRFPSNISDLSWRMLVRALSTRPIEHLYLVPVVMVPPANVLDSLRELVSHGATIYIGHEKRNHVVA
ncbi:hypothetical protein C8R45DRAFT_363383 [Mycena sanguinolenta]|nr:hypothetical protein C8R45DRAFT_363383 [Mycena sanguinolenta]